MAELQQVPWTQLNPPRPAPQVDPFSAMETMAKIRGMDNQNEIFKQQFKARQAMGDVARGAIGADGQMDYDKYARDVSTNPDTGWMAPEVLNQVEQRRNTQVERQGRELDIAKKQIDFANSAISGLVEKGQNITRQDLIDAGGRVIAQLQGAGISTGYGDPKSWVQILQTAPKDPQALAAWVRQVAQQGMDADKRLQYYRGQLEKVDAGGNTSMVNVAPDGNGGLAGTEIGNVPHSVTPGEANAIETRKTTESDWRSIPGATGPNQEYKIPRSAAAPMSGGTGRFTPTGPQVGPAAQPGMLPLRPGPSASSGPTATAGGTPAPQQGMGAAPGGLPIAGAPAGGASGPTPNGGPVAAPNAGGLPMAAQPGPMAPATAPGDLPMRPVGRGFNPQLAVPSGMTGANTAASEESARKGADITKQLDEAVYMGNSLLPRFEEELKTLEKFHAGGGTETRAQIASWAQALGAPQKLVDGIAGGDLGAMQEFNMLSRQQAIETLKASLGGQGRITNLEVEAFFKTYPHLSSDPRAIEKIYNFVKETTRKYYDMQQGMQEYQELMRKPGNPLQGKGLADFQAWYSKRQHDSGEVDYKPTYGRPLGVDRDGQLPIKKPGVEPASKLKELFDKHFGGR